MFDILNKNTTFVQNIKRYETNKICFTAAAN